MYVDYAEYMQYGGTASAIDFERLERKARQTIDYYTFRRIETVTDDVKMATCELIDYLAEVEAAGGKEIASETVGTHSVTYHVTKDSTKAKQREIITRNLAHTGLLYRGRC